MNSLDITDKEIKDSLRCPHCMSNKLEITDGEQFDFNYIAKCLDCNKTTTFWDNGFYVRYFVCDDCNSTNFKMKHTGGMSPCNWQCKTCKKIYSNATSGHTVSINNN